MKQFRKGDLAVVTGPLKMTRDPGRVFFDSGDVVEIIYGTDAEGDVVASRRSDGLQQFIDSESLTPFEGIAEDLGVDWGEVHDYVWEGDDDE